MEYRILGPITVRSPHGSLTLSSPNQRNLLCALLLGRNRVVPVERLIDVLWGDAPPKTALTALHGLISQLRRALKDFSGAQPIATRAPGYLLAVADGELDLDEFERLAAAGQAAQAAGAHAEASGLFSEALALWTGPALGGVTAERLLSTEIPRLEERRLAVLGDRIDADLALGRHHDLIPELAGLVSAQPFRERLRAQHMLALYRAGRQAEALALYRAGRRLFADELGLEPGEGLQRLERAILAADPGLSWPGGSGPAVTSAATSPSPPRPAELPPDITDFTGRGDLLAAIESMLRAASANRPGTPVVAISGKPGVGKSALAVRSAYRARDHFPDGQLFADLRGASAEPLDAAELLADWLVVLGASPQGLPRSLDGRVRAFRAYLAERRVLVVLDNAAAEAQVRPLLPSGAGCAAIVTSRTRLAGLEAARLVELDVLPQEHALELLARVAGAGRVAAEPAAAQAIVAACGGLPLALRLAGARLAARGHWPLTRLAERLSSERGRLDELAAGDVAVRASVGLSYEAADPGARHAFRLLSAIDVPSFAPWLAAALLETGEPEAERVLDHLADTALIDDAGVDPAGQPRYRFHDLLRVFARERLAVDEPAGARRAAVRRAISTILGQVRHMASSLSAYGVPIPLDSAAAEPQPARSERETLEWFAAERATLLAAVEQAAADDRWPAWELAAYLAPFFELRCHFDDWRRMQTMAVAFAERDGDPHGLAVARCGLGYLCVEQEAHEEAVSWLEAARDGFADLGDNRGEAAALRGLGEAQWSLGDVESARGNLRQCLALIENIGDVRAEAGARYMLALAEFDLGAVAEARAGFARSLELVRLLGDHRGEAYALHELGRTEREAERYELAARCFAQAVDLHKMVGDMRGAASSLNGLATTEIALGRAEDADRILREALDLVRGIGDRRRECYMRLSLAAAARSRGRLGEAAGQLDRALALARSIADQRQIATALGDLADIRLDQGRGREAARLAREALMIIEENNLGRLAGPAQARLGRAAAAAKKPA